MNLSDRHHEPLVLADLNEPGLTGSISVAPDVLIEIFELTIPEANGSARLAPKRRTRGKTLDLAGSGGQAERGQWHVRNGIKVRLNAETLDAEVDIAVKSDANVPQLADEIKSRIGQAVDRMLGKKIGTINIHVVEIIPSQDSSTR